MRLFAAVLALAAASAAARDAADGESFLAAEAASGGASGASSALGLATSLDDALEAAEAAAAEGAKKGKKYELVEPPCTIEAQKEALAVVQSYAVACFGSAGKACPADCKAALDAEATFSVGALACTGESRGGRGRRAAR